MSDNLYALIVAGGSGTRMASNIPKQFLLLDQKPVLMHTVEAFYLYSSAVKIIVVLPAQQIHYWQQLCENYKFNIAHQVVAGGDSRTASVRNGLDAIADTDGLVAIHDGVRPLVSQHIIGYAYQMAKEKGNAVASVKLKDSVRRILDGEDNKAEDREQFRLIQTPQTFKLKIIKEAYENMLPGSVLSDDASVIEGRGHTICLIVGDYKNIKITTAEDLSIAEALVKKTSDNN